MSYVVLCYSCMEFLETGNPRHAGGEVNDHLEGGCQPEDVRILKTDTCPYTLTTRVQVVDGVEVA